MIIPRETGRSLRQYWRINGLELDQTEGDHVYSEGSTLGAYDYGRKAGGETGRNE